TGYPQPIRGELLYIQIRCHCTAITVVLEVEIQLISVAERTGIDRAALIHLANQRVGAAISKFAFGPVACRHADTLLVGLHVPCGVVQDVLVADLDGLRRPYE